MLILSLFPGVDLLGKGFEDEGFCIVRGPDLIFGGDVYQFNPPPGRFDGVIGGPPCQPFSGINRTRNPQQGMALVNQFIRIVQQARPSWWLMENVGGIPDIRIDGYSWQRLDLRANWFGLSQSRKRYIQFGHRYNLVLTVEPSHIVPATEPICLASEGKKSNRRGWSDFCQLQGLPGDFDLPSFSISAKYRAVGNGVPVPMAQALARGIKNLRDGVTPCLCGCGREVTGKQKSAGDACRKRLQRRREKCDAPEL